MGRATCLLYISNQGRFLRDAMFTSLYFSLFLGLVPGIISANVEYTNHKSMDDGKYKLWWTFVNASDTFYFKVEVEAQGWIGFGITQLEYGEDWMRNGMDTYDVLVAGVRNGTPYSQEYLLLYQNKTQWPDHSNHGKQWKLTDASEVGSKTILEFNRKRLTPNPVNTHVRNRTGYIQITPGLRNFVWAYRLVGDTGKLDTIALKHDRSGLQPVKLIPVQEREPIHITGPPLVYAKRGTASVPLIATMLVFLPLLLVLAY